MDDNQATKENTNFPTERWQQSTPEQQGMDSNLLINALSYIDSNFKNYYNFIVVKNGYLVFEGNNKYPIRRKAVKIYESFFINAYKDFK